MRLTVAICTRNRPIELAKALTSCAEHAADLDQVIVSDDSTNDLTRELVSGDFPRVDYVRGPKRGLCANRNVAAAHARGTHVLFLDDDATLGKDYVSRIRAWVDALEKTQVGTTIVTGAVDEYGVLNPPPEQSFLGYQDRPASAERLVNVAMPAAVFPLRCLQQVRFDERLVHGYDEIDFVVRAVHAGFTVEYCSDAVNHHWRTPEGRAYYRGHQETARLYVTFKRYCIMEHRWLRAVAFAVCAPLQALAAGARRGGASGTVAAARSIVTATRYIAADALRAGIMGLSMDDRR